MTTATLARRCFSITRVCRVDADFAAYEAFYKLPVDQQIRQLRNDVSTLKIRVDRLLLLERLHE